MKKGVRGFSEGARQGNQSLNHHLTKRSGEGSGLGLGLGFTTHTHTTIQNPTQCQSRHTVQKQYTQNQNPNLTWCV